MFHLKHEYSTFPMNIYLYIHLKDNLTFFYDCFGKHKLNICKSLETALGWVSDITSHDPINTKHSQLLLPIIKFALER